MNQMLQQPDTLVLSHVASGLGVANPVVTTDIAALLQQPEQQQALTKAMLTAASDPSHKADLQQSFVDLGAKGFTGYETRQYIMGLGQNPQSRLQRLAKSRQLTAPLLRADPAVIATRLDPILRAQLRKRNAGIDAFVRNMCARRQRTCSGCEGQRQGRKRNMGDAWVVEAASKRDRSAR